MAHPPPPVPPDQQSDKAEGATPPDVAAAKPDAARPPADGETDNRTRNFTPHLRTQDR